MNAKICIKKPIYKDYLNHLFLLEDNAYIVSRNHDFGKLLTSLVQYSNLPKSSDEIDMINLKLPTSRCTVNAHNYHLFYSKEAQEKLNDMLEVLFNIDFDRYYLQGRKLNQQQKDIIQSFIISRKLVTLIGDNETLKKRQYRDELKTLKLYTKMLIERAYYRNERIQKALTNTNILIFS